MVFLDYVPRCDFIRLHTAVCVYTSSYCYVWAWMQCRETGALLDKNNAQSCHISMCLSFTA